MQAVWRCAALGVLIGLLSGARLNACDPAPDGLNWARAVGPVVQQLLVPTVVLGGEGKPCDRGWFGVRLESPGLALSKHLNLVGRGLMVVNICKNSPAEHCGLQRYDIITDFGNKEIGNAPAGLAVQIRVLGPGADVHLVVLRNAKEMKLSTKLASWADADELQWIYEASPEVVIKDTFDVSGKILQEGPGGEITVQVLNVHSLPQKYQALLGKLHPRTIELWNEDGRLKVKCRTVKDEMVIEVEQDADGPIHVRRIIEEENAESIVEEVYVNEEVLKSADEEAFEVLKDCDMYRVHSRAFGVPEEKGLFRWDFELHEPPESERSWAERKPFERLKELYSENQMNLERVKQWHEKIRKGLESMDHGLLRKLEDELHRTDERIRQADRWIEVFKQIQSNTPQYSFRVESDGRVIAIIRKGDSELSKVYESVEEFRKKSPKLFERYERLETSQ